MTQTLIGHLDNGDAVHNITLRSDMLSATFMTLGARLISLHFDGSQSFVPDQTLDDAKGAQIYAGALIAPVLNRLSGAKADLDGTTLTFPANEGASTFLHSGDDSTQGRVWTIASLTENAVTFEIALAPDLFPGNRLITVRYALEGAEFRVNITATSDAPTLMSPGFHPYWSLSGQGRAGHNLALTSTRYLPATPDNIPTGDIRDTHATRFDYAEMRPAEFDLDTCFLMPDDKKMNPAVTLKSEAYRLEISTDAPACHVYTGDPSGIAVEPEMWPDAPNHAGFPSIRLAPGDTFRQAIIHRFSKT